MTTRDRENRVPRNIQLFLAVFSSGQRFLILFLESIQVTFYLMGHIRGYSYHHWYHFDLHFPHILQFFFVFWCFAGFSHSSFLTFLSLGIAISPVDFSFYHHNICLYIWMGKSHRILVVLFCFLEFSMWPWKDLAIIYSIYLFIFIDNSSFLIIPFYTYHLHLATIKPQFLRPESVPSVPSDELDVFYDSMDIYPLVYGDMVSTIFQSSSKLSSIVSVLVISVIRYLSMVHSMESFALPQFSAILLMYSCIFQFSFKTVDSIFTKLHLPSF